MIDQKTTRVTIATERAHARLRRLIAAAVAPVLLVIAAAAPAAADEPLGTRPVPATASALVVDQYGETMSVSEPVFYRPAGGFALGSGSKGAKLKEVRVWRGAHEILVALETITRIEVIGPSDQDLLQVRLTLAGGKKLEGKVERDLELRGRVEFGQYQIRFERLRAVTIRA